MVHATSRQVGTKPDLILFFLKGVIEKKGGGIDLFCETLNETMTQKNTNFHSAQFLVEATH